MAISGTVSATISATDTVPVGVEPTVNVGTTRTFTNSITNGTSANQANKLYHATITFGGSPTDLDLTAITNGIGTALNFTRVTTIEIDNVSTANTITVGGSGITNQWTSAFSSMTLRPKTAAGASVLVMHAPDATAYVVGSSNKILRLTGTSGQQVKIVILGS